MSIKSLIFRYILIFKINIIEAIIKNLFTNNIFEIMF